MRLVFAHDHIFRRDDDGKIYSGGSYNNAVWERYLKHFDEVVVIARLEELSHKGNRIYNEFGSGRVTLKPIPSLSGPIKQYTNKKEAERIIRNELLMADALIARLPSEAGNLAVDAARDMNKPYMVEVVTCAWDAMWHYGKIMAKIYAPIARYKMKKRVGRAPYALYVTNSFLQGRYPNRGVNVSVSDVEITDIKSGKPAMDDGIWRIGMIGSIANKIKGWDVALRALSLLAKKGLDFEFYILGDGDDKPFMREAGRLGVAERVHACGVLPSGKPVADWLDNIDIFILPSYSEGMPRAVIEAMSRGCAVIGSEAGDIPELIDRSCIHKRGDYRKLALLIERVMDDRDYWHVLSVKNLMKAKKFMKNVLDESRDRFLADFVSRACSKGSQIAL